MDVSIQSLRAKKISKSFKDAAGLTQDSMGITGRNALYHSHSITSSISVLLTGRHHGLRPKGNRDVFPGRCLTKRSTICSTSDSVFGNKPASVPSALQDLKT
jgi:hypothetical protein